jgi:hypothetical protein
MDSYITLIIVAVCLFALIIGVVLGYFLARLDGIYARLMQEDRTGPVDFFRKENCKWPRPDPQQLKEKITAVSIDDSKFVTDIKTDNISKVNELELGKTTTQQDTINQSVSKLAQLKGR